MAVALKLNRICKPSNTYLWKESCSKPMRPTAKSEIHMKELSSSRLNSRAKTKEPKDLF